jgi:hypothetical protein
MILTPKQIDYFNAERQKLIIEMQVKNKHKMYNLANIWEYVDDRSRMEAFKLLSELHNLEVKKNAPKSESSEPLMGLSEGIC